MDCWESDPSSWSVDVYDSIVTVFLTLSGSVLMSTGFWAYINSKNRKIDARTELILGLAHEQIIATGERYLERGWVSYQEYEDFCRYLYDPYVELGGNGTGTRIKKELDSLRARRGKDE